MGRVMYGSARTIHVPESRIVFCQSYGWTVIARDSDVPLPDPEMLPPGQTYWPHSAMLARRETPPPSEQGED